MHERDGVGFDASFQNPYQIVMDSKGFIYVADSTSIRRISPDYEVTTIAKIDGTLRRKLSFSSLNWKNYQGSDLCGIALDEKNGMIYASDTDNFIIWNMKMDEQDVKILTGQKGESIKEEKPFLFQWLSNS